MDPQHVHMQGQWADVKGLRIYARTATDLAAADLSTARVARAWVIWCPSALVTSNLQSQLC